MSMIYCQQCGKEMHQSALHCPACGAPNQQLVAARSTDATSGNPFFWFKKVVANYTGFTGRARRKEFWMFQLAMIIISMVMDIIMSIFFASSFIGILVEFSRNDQVSDASMGKALVSFLTIIAVPALFFLTTLLPSLAVTVRRLHDINRSGWWLVTPTLAQIVCMFFALAQMATPSIIFGLVSVGLGITLLVFYCTEGTRGDNRFGPDPKVRK